METRFLSSDPGAGPERRRTRRTRRRRRNLEGRRVRRTGAGPAVQMSKGTSTKQLNFLVFKGSQNLEPVLRIRIHRIHVFLGLLDPDPDQLVRGMDPDPGPSIIKQK
jgi:hypothetical protein